ncbi:MAG: hypothetical protein HOE30_25935, partial [Deltaproteobacteria bacterium]|nr:hypothetical protein [Deltaproteobacteria bacterium]
RQFVYFVTESTRHNAEYLPYFCRTAEQRKYYGVPDRGPVSMENTRQRAWMKDSGVEQDAESEIPPLRSSHEYASLIIEAKLTGKPFAFNGNVMNQERKPRPTPLSIAPL